MAMNKDFYRDLPGMVCIMLDKYITKYKKEPWFPEAWEEYRQHILNSSMDDMKMPGFVFNKYLKKDSIKHFATQDSDVIYGIPQQKKFPLPDADHVKSAIKFFNYVEPKYEKQLAKAILEKADEFDVDLSEMNIGDNNRFKKYLPEELKHWGIKGQKWGVRRFENYDGTLTPEGRERYGYGDISLKKTDYKEDTYFVSDKKGRQAEVTAKSLHQLENDVEKDIIQALSQVNNMPYEKFVKILEKNDKKTIAMVNNLIDQYMEVKLNILLDKAEQYSQVEKQIEKQEKSYREKPVKSSDPRINGKTKEQIVEYAYEQLEKEVPNFNKLDEDTQDQLWMDYMNDNGFYKYI